MNNTRTKPVVKYNKYKTISTNISSLKYSLIKKYLPTVKITRPCKYSNHDKINAMLYVLKTGCQWRELPEKYPPYSIVHKYFRTLCVHGVFDKIVKNLCFGKLFYSQNKITYPDSIVIIDSKSIRTTSYYHGTNKGYNGHKNVKGIKLCPVIDRSRRIWSLQIFPANTDECKCFKIGLERAIQPKITGHPIVVIGDRYFDSNPFKEYCKKHLKTNVLTLCKDKKRASKFDSVEDRIKFEYEQKKIKKLINPIRYIVEQFFAHIDQARRLTMVYERKSSSYLGFVNLRIIQLMLNRLTPEG